MQSSIIKRLPKYGRVFVRLAVFFERAFRRFDNRQVRTFVGASAIPVLSMRVGGHRAYADWCFHAGVYAGLLASLNRQRLRVLDVGCGAGEIVPGILQVISKDSTYLGVDIDARLVRQCQQTFIDPRLRFSLVSGMSPFYECDSTVQGRGLPEVCVDDQWDVIIAKAVFDHLSPKDVETYLHLFSRGLADGGLIIATVFLLNAEYWTKAKTLNGRFHFEDIYPGHPGFRYSAAFNPIPEAQLAIESGRLAQLLATAGLQIERVIAGTWRDPQGQTGLDMPDTLLLARRK